MKKITVIISVLALAAFFGCQKNEESKPEPVVESEPTTTMSAPTTTADPVAPEATPEAK